MFVHGPVALDALLHWYARPAPADKPVEDKLRTPPAHPPVDEITAVTALGVPEHEGGQAVPVVNVEPTAAKPAPTE